MNKILSLLIILLLGQQLCFCQGSQLTDSLLAELPKAKEDTAKAGLLISLAKASINNGEFEKTLAYCKQALSLSEKLNFKKGIANAYHVLGWAYSNQGDYPEALKNNFAALKIREETGDKIGIAATSNNLGIIFMNQDNYPRALTMLFKALKINEETGHKDWMAGNYNNIALIQMSQKEYDEALKNLRAALKIYEELGDRPSQNHPYNNMSGIYHERGDFAQALKYCMIALKIRQEMGDQYEVGNSFGSIGLTYEAMGNYAEALKNYFISLKIANEVGNKYGRSLDYLYIGSVKFRMNDFGESKLYYDSSLVLSRELGSIDLEKYYYEGLASLDSARGDFKSSLKHYKLFVQYRDSLLNDGNKKQLVQQQMQYDFDKKETATRAEQDKKDAVAQKELQKQKLVRNGFVGGFAVVMLFAGVFFTQRNKIKKGKKRSDELLLNILPEEVAEELKSKGSAEAKQFDDVTVMFTDFKGFTKISETLSPAELVAEIHACFKAFDHIISRHNIEKIKTIGDSYMCAGGLPVSNTTNGFDVVNAALEIQQFMKQHNEQRKIKSGGAFEIRIGIHTGPVVAGIVGVKKFAYDIWGDTVNIASRMESSGEAGKINISGSTYASVKDKFSCIYRGKIEAKNKGEIDMYFVEG